MSSPVASGGQRTAAGHRSRSTTTEWAPNPTSPAGAYVVLTGIVTFVIATFIDWVSTTGADPVMASGYEADTVIPLLAYLGLGLAVALLFALSRARGRQHRGLTLVTMAVGLAAVGISASYVVHVPGAFGHGAELHPGAGAWSGLVGAIIWSVGAGLLARQPEGDDDWRPTRVGAAPEPHG